MKFSICYWLGQENIKRIVNLIDAVPSEKYSEGDRIKVGNKMLKRTHSFISYSFETDIGDEDFTIFFQKIFKDCSQELKELKSNDNIDVGFKIIAKSKDNLPYGIEKGQINFIMNYANWLSFDFEENSEGQAPADL